MSDKERQQTKGVVYESDVKISKLHQNTLIIETHVNNTKEELEDLKQNICNATLQIKWLDDKGIELVFCMFGCEPYLRKEGRSDEHFEMNCQGNPNATSKEKSLS